MAFDIIAKLMYTDWRNEYLILITKTSSEKGNSNVNKGLDVAGDGWTMNM